MGTTLRLPSELQQFLGLPGPQTLLIRGPPGTGKTTFALALLEAFGGQKQLVTNRVSREELARSFPWLGENGASSIDIVDASQLPRGVKGSSRSVAHLHRLVHGSEAGDREVEEFLWLPEPLQEAWSRLRPGSRSMTVVDSWDALVEEYLGGPALPATTLPGAEGPDRQEVERLLLRRMGRTPNHLVLVLERSQETQLDYLVNGTVVMDRAVRGDRLERWLTLPKLRGTRIAHATYPFTLEGARFECIDPVRPYSELAVGRATPEPSIVPGYLWPGSEPFAEAFGRLPAGRITLIERGEGVQQHIPRLLVCPMIAHVLQSGSRVTVVPPLAQTPLDVWRDMRGTVRRRTFLANLRILTTRTMEGEGSPKERAAFAATRLVLEGTSGTEPPARGTENPAFRFLLEKASFARPSLAVIYLTGMEALLSSQGGTPPDWRERFPDTLRSAVVGRPVHVVAVGRSGTPFVSALREASEVHLRIEARQGRVFVQGDSPWTPSFVLTEPTEGRPYGLLRVV